MTALELVFELERRGVRLDGRDGKLRFRAPKGSLTPELRDAMAANKDAILTLLRERHDRTGTADTVPAADERIGGRAVHEHFEDAARRWADEPALVFGESRLTYGQLNRRANRLARRLRAAGVGPETRVPLCLERGADLIVALLAVLKAGGAYVPLDPAYPVERLAFLIEDSAGPVLITEERLEGVLPAQRPPLLLLDRHADAIAREGADDLGIESSADQLAYVIYTSGSTGRPKGVAVTHRAINRLVLDTDYVRLSPADRVAQASTASFDAATFEIWGALLHGARLIGIPKELLLSPERFAERLRFDEISVLFITTALFNRLAAETPRIFATLDSVLFGGEAVDPAWVRRVLEHGPPRRLLHVYGPTETTTFATWHRVLSVPADAATVPIGRPIARTTACLLDRDLNLVPTGVPGELYLGGPGVARGYLDRPALTATRFVPDPRGGEPGARLYRTGDLCRWTEAGALEFLRRIDRQVKVRGFRIELEEIEAVVREHRGVREVAVLVREDSPGDRRLVGYVVPDSDPHAFDDDDDGGSAELSDDRVSRWRDVYDGMIYSDLAGEAGEAGDETFNIAGWRSTYTGEPIGAEPMREQVDQAVERVLEHRPRRVLELGCGTGLLLFRIAPDCDEYWGSDFSDVALGYVRGLADERGLRGVRLLERTAENFEGIEPESFDAVILNSVAQYFPSVDYFVRVVEGAVDSVRDGGFLFLGDLRDLTMLPALQADVQLQRVPESMSRSKLRRRVDKHLAEEQELVLAPSLFTLLARRIARITDVEIQLKRGRHRNELTGFRYDVVLRVGGEHPEPRGMTWVDWDRQTSTPASLRARLQSDRPDVIGLRGVPNARVAVAVRTLQLLTEEGAPGIASAIRQAALRALEGAVDPEDLWVLGDELGYRVDVRGSVVSPGGCDVLFRRRVDGALPAALACFGDEPAEVDGWEELATHPLRAMVASKLVPRLRRFLAEKMPDYMVPSTFVVLDSMPLNANGKIDRKALPAPGGDRPDLDTSFVAPRNDVERVLAKIWSEVLGIDQVGIHDNLFELGGDSILSIQVVARANQAGLPLTPMQLFQHQTVAELAGVVGEARAVVAEQGPVEGPVALTPIQRWFLEQDLPALSHFNQAVLLELRQRLDPAHLEQAVGSLLRHHDALRLRYSRGPSGWNQAGAGLDAATTEEVFVRLDLSDVPAERRAERVEAEAASIQRQLDVERGPIVRVALFELAPGEDRLLLVIHHLAVDGVSWRLLMEDLLSAYGQHARSGRAELPAKTTSFREWAERLAEYAGSAGLAQELPHWRGVVEAPYTPIPRDRADGDNTAGAVETVVASLDASETRALLQDVPAAYRTRIDDVLLTAVARALSGWTGARGVTLTLEGHGREPLFDDVDLSRTVGWFTSMFPVRLELGASATLDEDLRAVKEQLRAIPNRGIGYGLLRDLAKRDLDSPAEVGFNYLGQFGQAVPEGTPVSAARESPGPLQDPRGARTHLIDISGAVVSGRLELSWIFNPSLHERQTVERVAGAFLATLREIMAHCVSPDAWGRTPSDFPLADVDQGSLDRLIAGDRNVEDLYPLSPLQAGMLFHVLFAPEAGTYFEQVSCTLEGSFRPDAFRDAWAAALARHPALRTRFAWDGLPVPLQVVHRDVDVPWIAHDFRDVEPSARQRRIEALLDEERRRGFDLTEAPLMRLAMAQLSGGSWFFVWSFHHLLLDGWSLPILLREVLTDYEARIRGHVAPIDPPRPYRDFIAWLGRRDRSRSESYWRTKLSGFTAPTPVGSASFAATAPGGEEYAYRQLRVGPETTEALERLARERHVTASTMAQAAWALLLSRYSGENDVVFGVTVSGRSAPIRGIESMLGMFINTLPARVQISSEASLVTWLAELQSQQGELLEHEHTPLVEIQRWSDVRGGRALFDSLLVFENYPIDQSLRRQAGSLEVRDARFEERTNFPITLLFMPGPELTLRAQYDGRRFDGPAVERMLGHLARLLEGMVADPERTVGSLDLLTDSERAQVVTEWNRTSVDYGETGSIAERLVLQAARTPEAPAVTFEGQSWSYAELDRRSNRLAHHLQGLGVGPETRVGVLLERSAELVATLVAVVKAGGAYVPLDPDYPTERVAFMLADSGATVLVTSGRSAEGLGQVTAQVVRLDVDAERIAAESAKPPSCDTLDDSLVYTIYTSGSTGRPKGADNTQRGLSNRLSWMQSAYGLDATDTVLQKTPYSFDVSVWEFFWPLLYGARLVLARPGGHRDADYLSQLIRDEGVTTLHFVPSMLGAFLESDGFAGVTSVRRVLSSGEALSHELQERFFARSDAELHNLYGPTEASIDVTSWACVRGDGSGRVPIGRPIGNLRVYVLDEELSPVPPGVPGELYLGGVGLARGYHGRPALTAATFVPDPFGPAGERLYRTGDRTRWLDDGSVEYLGRLDGQVKLRGFRIEPGEIEVALASHPGVRQAAVVALIDGADGAAGATGSGSTRLAAYVALEPGAFEGSAAAELRGWLSERLPAYMVPSSWTELEALPLTPSGKLDRKSLPRPEAGGGSKREYVAPRTETETRLAALWQEVLGVERVGVHDDFFELGGDSIVSIQLASRAQREALRLTPRHVFEHPTIAALAIAVGTARAIDAEQGIVEGPVRPTPIQRWFLEQELPRPSHFNQAVMLELTETLDPQYVRSAVETLLRHHDALRLHLGAVADAGTLLNAGVAAVPVESVFEVHDLGQADDERRTGQIETRAAELQRSLDLDHGPLMRVALFRSDGGTDRLLIVIHHLAVDGVSWRILLEDLLAAYGQIATRGRAELAPKTTSFLTWSERLEEYASRPEIDEQREYWHGVARDRGARLPRDLSGGNDAGTSEIVSISLDDAETRALLQDVPSAYRTRIDDVLLTALVQTFRGWTGSGELLVALEGHGREELFDDVDVSRTVGWFTSLYPVRLQIGEDRQPGSMLKSVKEQLRAVPGRGLGFGLLRYLRGAALENPAEVSFNYLGQFDRVLPESAPVRLAAESVGALQDPAGRRPHLIDVSGGVAGGRLNLSWIFSRAVHQRSSIERLATEFLARLRTLIEHCVSPEAWGWTPSDFPLVPLEQASLDRLIAGDRGVEDLYPLSPLQSGMLFHSLFAPDSGVYCEQLSCTLEGNFDPDAFRTAWEQVVQRHPVLRSRFAWEGVPEPLQVVHRHVELPWHQDDWSSLAAGEREKRFDDWLEADRQRGYDAGSAPLMRIALIRWSATAWRLIWSHHHLLLDGWSLPLLLKDLLVSYEAINSGIEVVPPGTRPYRDFIAWLARRDAVDSERYWRETLAGFTEPTPLGIGTTSGQGDDYVHVQTHLAAEVTTGLDDLARARRLTLNTLAQAAWALLLGRYSGETDVLFGVTVSGRSAPIEGIESMLGMFINTVPARVRWTSSASLVSWLELLQSRQGELLEHEHSSLTDIQGWSDVPRGRPLFESLLVFENYPVDASLASHGGSLAVSDVRLHERTNFPLTVLVLPGRELTLRAMYDGRRFDGPAVERMLGHLARLLEGMVADPERTVGSLDLLTDSERAQVVTEWNRTSVDYGETGSIAERLVLQAARTPEAPAVTFEGQSWSYAELDRRSNRLAHHLQGLGVGPETRVGVLLERSAELVATLVAVVKAGGAYVPLDPDYPTERVAFMLADSGATVLVTSGRSAEGLGQVTAQVVRLDVDAERIAAESAKPPSCDTLDDSLVYTIYTSGSTGRPKGADNTQRGLSNRLSWMQSAYGLDATDTVLQKTPYSFDVSVWEFFWPLLYGARLVLARPGGHRDADYLSQLIRDEGVTTLHFVPSMLGAFLESDGFAGVTSVRRVLSSGEALSHELQERFFARSDAELHNLYGPTEASIDVTSWACVRGDGSGRVPIGRPIGNLRVYVLDEELSPVPPGVPGELYLGGAGLARGYHGRPALTAATFVPDPFGPAGERLYRTGDRTRWLDDGSVEYLGRLDGQVKLRGFRIEPGEIEVALASHPGVRQAAVVALTDGAAGAARLAAYVALEPGAFEGSAAAELRGWLSERLPAYMVPSSWTELEALPLTPSGKLDRKSLPRPEAGGGSEREYVAPRTETETRLAAVWQEVLGVERVGVHDDFFELGGHSLLATQVVSRARVELGVELPLHRLFDAPTVAGMAVAVESVVGVEGDAAPPMVPVDRDAELPLSFAQERLWFLDRLVPGNPFYNMFGAVRMTGPLDVSALRRTFDEIVRRHEALRTTFGESDGRPVQRISPAAIQEMPVVDLSTIGDERHEAAVRRLAEQEALRPFALDRGPLIRTRILRLGAERHVLMLTLHHIVSDGWSMGVLVREVAALYPTFVAGRTSPLPELPLQYADFAHWQRGWFRDEVLARQLDYWRERLADVPVLELPTDRPRPPVQTYRGSTEPFALTAELSEGIRNLGRREGVTPFMVLLAAYQSLLGRYAGQDDVVVGSGIANRNRAEIEGLIGFFVNMLVMRTDLAGDPTVRQLVGRVRQVSLDAYARQDLPFEKLVEELQPDRDLSREPLFQVAIVLQNAPQPDVDMGTGLRLEGLQVEGTTSKYDLTLYVWEHEGRLRGFVEYSTDLFDRATIGRMIEHYGLLLQGMVEAPERRVSDIPWIGVAESARVLETWNATSSSIDERAVHVQFAEQAAREVEAPACTSAGRTLSYGALDRRSLALAGALRARGVGPETRVALLLDRGPELLVAMLATLRAGGAYVPVDPSYPSERVRWVLGDSGATVLLTEERWRERCGEYPGEVLCADGWPEDGGELESSVPDALQSAYVIYTSGSTGRPKGVVVSHGSLSNLVAWHRSAYEVTSSDRATQIASPAFDASVWEVWPYLTAGASLHAADETARSSGEALKAWLASESITLSFVPTPLTETMLDGPWPETLRLRALLTGGDRLHRGSERALPFALVNHYGPTESTVVATCGPVGRGEELPAIGGPILNTRSYVLDAHGGVVPIGVAGELYLGGSGLARGYLNRPGLTAERFVPDPFSSVPGGRLYRTGDRVRWNAEGRLEFLGRVDAQVKVRGYRIEPGEIESLLTEHAGVRQSVVQAREDVPGQRRLVGYVVADPDWLEGRGGDSEDQDSRVSEWRALYESTYGQAGSPQVAGDDAVSVADGALNIVGWNSSYTGEAIPAEEMREWRDCTVERIRSYGPRRVLEIGCGTGMLLLRLAPDCERYVGCDFSASALSYVAGQVEAAGLAQVELLERTAENLGDLEPGSFDTVVLNSVIQYFPGVDYLVRVLEGASRLVAPGGRIFVGDVRSLPLLEAHHASIQAFQSAEQVSRDELRRRVSQQLSQDKELVIDPDLFRALASRWSGAAEVLLKRGQADNELTRFRYDAVLHPGEPARARLPEVWEDWEASGLTPASVEERLATGAAPVLGLRGVPNGRVASAVRTAELLHDAEGPRTAGDLLQAASSASGVDPEALWRAGERLGYRVDVLATGASGAGRYDVLLRMNDGATDLGPALVPPARQAQPTAWTAYANDPMRALAERQLVPALRDWLSERLPEFMVPSVLVLLPEMPQTAHGKIDHRALPAPGGSRPELSREYVAPRNELERELAALWSEVLSVDRIGVEDNFFELGGHSLLATQLVSRVRSDHGVELPLRAMFESPTVTGLARAVRQARLEDAAPMVRVPRDGNLPLSFAQQRLWFLDQLVRDNPFYNVPAAVRLTGDLDVDALERTFDEIVGRHEALRTTFTTVDGAAVQVVQPRITLRIPLVDLRGLDPVGRERVAERLAYDDSRLAFDLTRDVLIRATLLRLDEDAWMLLVTTHHIVSDGWSMGVLVKEFGALYHAFTSGQPSPLPDLPVQYADFAAWQREWLQGDVLDRQLAYWKERLEDIPALNLPTDHPRPSQQSFRGATHVFAIPPELTQAVRRLSDREGVTPFMTVLAAFQALLYRYTRQTDIAVGSGIANRNRSEIEGLIGFFVNMLVMRGDLGGNPSFSELVARVRDVALGAFAHQDLPFELMVEMAHPERDLGREPLFQVAMFFQNFPISKQRFPTGLGLAPFEVDNRTTKFDLTLFVWDAPGEMTGKLEYSTDLFEPATIERMAEHLVGLLLAAVEDPSRTLLELPLLTEAERKRLLDDWSRAGDDREHRNEVGRKDNAGPLSRGDGDDGDDEEELIL